ncbi:hypothetical protein BDR26DRAFT_1008338 [Obelidium mucronatum]|nr:hypothetical protein BDR26DRAFT_1008338 [Obelidium mucronatum]
MGGGRSYPDPPAGTENDPTLNYSLSASDLPKNAGKGCYYSPNLQLGVALDVNKKLMCDPGWYCPYLNSSDSATLPVYCPPSRGCATFRLQAQPCSAQGKYEPILCKPGFYCPDSHTILPCPQGFFCPTGTVTPRQCTMFTSCPKGSHAQAVYGFFIFMGVFDVLLAVLIIIYKYHLGHIPKISLGSLSALLGGPTKALEVVASKAERMALAEKKSPATSDFVEESISPEELAERGMATLVTAFKESFRNRDLRMNFRFDNLQLTLNNGKTILQGVTGEIRSKRMTAIIGPSGAGKTTFMNVLMGKVSRTGGELYINGEQTEMQLYKKIVGYVPQEDIMIRDLTVRENVLHSARVRLPRNWTSSQINNHVDNVLRALNLSHVANSCIGDETTRGISGGQRKRVNIAMELAAAPLTIFLDEPTSGLDATSSLDVANILHSVASLGLTIVAVIHQPRIEIFRKFDDVLMIAPGGRVAYLGPTALAPQYFETLGFYFEPMANASDTLMDILAGKGVNRLFTLTPDQLVEIWEDRHSRDIYNEPPAFFNMTPSEDEEEEEEEVVKSAQLEPDEIILAPHGRPSSIFKVEQWLGNMGDIDRQMSSSPPRDNPLPPVEAVDAAELDNETGQFLVAGATHSRYISEAPTAVAHSLSRSGVLHLDERGLPSAPLTPSRPSEAPTVIHPTHPATPPRSIRSKKSHAWTVSKEDHRLEQDFHLVVPNVVKERGASFSKQVFYCHQRSLIQQSRQVGALALELFVAMFAGMLMGISTIGKVKELMNGIYWGKYVLLSPAPLDLLALYGLLIGIGVALAGAPSGVKVFGEEKPVFWREAASGHSKLAYFIGKNLATIYRLVLTSLHFTGLYMMLAKPVIDPYTQYALVLFQFFGVYGIACIVSMIVQRDNAALLAAVISFFASILCGYGPSLNQAKTSGYLFLFELSFNKWAAEAHYAVSINVYDKKIDIDLMASIFGYTLTQVPLDLAMCAVLGLGMRIVGYFLMIGLNRDKQR